MSQAMLIDNYRSELEKVAATAALKAIRALVNAGNIAKAESLAARLVSKGALKTSKQGSQLRFLGSGSEGPAHLVIGAKDAPSRVLVRKMMDPSGAIFSKQQAAEKFNVLRRLRATPAKSGGHMMSRGNQDFAKVVSNKLHKTPTGGRYYHSEYVPGRDMYDTVVRSGGLPKATKKHLKQLWKSQGMAGDSYMMGRRGKSIKDAMSGRASRTGAALDRSNPTNIMVTPSGKPKIVDFYVSPKGSTGKRITKAGPDSSRTAKKEQLAKALREKSPLKRSLRERAAGWRARVPGANTSVADIPIEGGLRKADVVNTLRGLGPGSPRVGKAVPKARYTGQQPKGSGPPVSPEYERMLAQSRTSTLLQQRNRAAVGALKGPSNTTATVPGVIRGGAKGPPVNPFGPTIPRGFQTAPTRNPATLGQSRRTWAEAPGTWVGR